MGDQRIDVCRHCGGVIQALAEPQTPDGNRLYACDRCGCHWRQDRILTHKGTQCPVHGRTAARSAVVRIIGWLVAQEERRPTPAQH
jgi:hypothetical protein